MGKLEKLLGDSGNYVLTALKTIVTEVTSDPFQEFVKGFKGLCLLMELGERNWVVVFPVDSSIVSKGHEEIDNYFVDYIEKNVEIYHKMWHRIFISPILKPKKELLKQVCDAMNFENYNIACVAMSTIIEYMLATETNYNCTNIKKMVDRLENKIDMPIDEECIAYIFGLNGFLGNYTMSTNGFEQEKEPRYVNRHWIAHGRMYRNLTKIDAYQMLLAIYAFVVLVDGEKKE